MAQGDQPTAKQLATLRRLAAERGQSFIYPQTRRQASREISRLLASARSSRAEIAAERADIAAARARIDGTQVRPSEIEGYGSSARWKGRG